MWRTIGPIARAKFRMALRERRVLLYAFLFPPALMALSFSLTFSALPLNDSAPQFSSFDPPPGYEFAIISPTTTLNNLLSYIDSKMRTVANYDALNAQNSFFGQSLPPTPP
jgi:hypothetical protein